MKIRYVLNTAYGAGGTIRTVFNQANELCAEHDVEIASVYRTREQPAFTLDPRVTLVPLTNLGTDGRRRGAEQGRRRPLRRTRLFANLWPHGRDYVYGQWDPQVDAAIVRYFWRQRDGILVTTRPGLNLLSAWCAPKRLIRVGQDHMNLGSYKPGLRDAIISAYPRLDAVTVLTQRDLADWRTALAGRPLHLECIPNGIPASPHPSASLDSTTLVAAGRLGAQKGFDLLLDAYAEVHAKHPEWSLDIYGGGDWQKRLTAQIDRLGLTGAATLRGISKDLDEVFTRAAMYLLSSRKEGLPMVLLEAMSAGVPPIAFDCPTGPAEVLTDGVDGLLIPAEDTAALASAICALIEDPQRRKELGAAARKSSARYAIPVIVDAWQDLFGRLTAARG